MNWGLALRALPYIACAIFAFGGAWKIQQYRINDRDAKLAVCHDANKTGAETVRQLMREAQDARTVCEKTLRSKERTLAELKRIDGLTGSQSALRTPHSALKGGSHETTDSPDPVLAELNGMFNSDAR